MKSIKIAGPCLVAMFVMSMVVSATASAAAPVWEQCRESNVEKVTKWETNQCLKASATGKFQWREITGTEKVSSNGTLELKDTETIAGSSAVICTGTNAGSIGPGKFDRVESVTVAKCTAVSVCESSPAPTAKAVGLPWQTELFETEGRVRNKITATTNGQPGWEVTCNVPILGTITDTCRTVAGKEGTPLAENKQAAGNVQITFDSKSGSASCTEGSATSGKVIGAIQVFSPEYAVRVQ